MGKLGKESRCGELAVLPNERRRNANLTLTCKCGNVHLALNAVRLDTYLALKARAIKKVGDKPSTQLSIESIQVFLSMDGKTETVFRRNKRGGERMYTRKAKPTKP